MLVSEVPSIMETESTTEPPAIEDRRSQHPSILSNDVLETFEIINQVGLTTAISVFGIVSNIINILVYKRIGFKESITVSLFALAVSDLGITSLQVYVSLCQNPNFRRSSDLGMFLYELSQLAGGIQRTNLVRVSIWITVLTIVERCVCITLPMKVKQIFTPMRSVVMVVTCAILIFLSSLPMYLSLYVGRRPVEGTNRTRLGVLRTSSAMAMRGTTIMINLFIQFFSLSVIIVSISALLYSLRQQKIRLIFGNGLNAAREASHSFEAPISQTSRMLDRLLPTAARKLTRSRVAPDRSDIYGRRQDTINPAHAVYNIPCSHGEAPEQVDENGQQRAHPVGTHGPPHASDQPNTGQFLRVKQRHRKESPRLPQPSSSRPDQDAVSQGRPPGVGPVVTGPDAILRLSQRRNWRIGKMVAVLSLISVISYIPGTALLVISVVEPQFGASGRYCYHQFYHIYMY